MNFISLGFFFAGALFILLAAVGAIKFPDFFMRMAAVSKASTLGVILCALAAAFHFADPLSVLKMALLVVFFLLSSPIATHLLGRTTYRNGVPLFHRTRKDKDADKI